MIPVSPQVTSSLKYVSDHWQLFAAIGGAVAFLFRPAVRAFNLTTFWMLHQHKMVVEHEELQVDYVREKRRADEWAAAFADVEKRYDALRTEFDRLGSDLLLIRSTLAEREDLVRRLTSDRDGLVAYSRQLIGLLYEHHIALDITPPQLRSVDPKVGGLGV